MELCRPSLDLHDISGSCRAINAWKAAAQRSKCCQLRARSMEDALRCPTGRVARIRFPSPMMEIRSTSWGMVIISLGTENSGLLSPVLTSTV